MPSTNIEKEEEKEMSRDTKISLGFKQSKRQRLYELFESSFEEKIDPFL